MIFLRFLAPQELRAGTAVRVQEICRRMDFTLRYTPSGHNALAFRSAALPPGFICLC